MADENGWAPAEPERASTSGRFVQPKNWMEVTEGSGKGKKVFQRFKCRILGSAISGFTAWSADNKPLRVRAEKDVPADFNWRLKEDGPYAGKRELPKTFWAFPIWDYETSEVKVWEVSQAGIRDAIGTLARNPDWGSPLGYDITVERSGKGLDTKYAVSPSPKTAIPDDAAEAMRLALAAGFDLNRLFDGGDPFSAPAAEAVPAAPVELPF